MVCTKKNGDPYSGGPDAKVPCCSGLQEVNKDWDNNGNWYWKCIAGGGSPDDPTPNGKLGLWSLVKDHPSCKGTYNSSDAYTIEQDSQGYTFSNISIPRDRCSAIDLSKCRFNIKNLKSLKFTFRLQGCNHIWIAPIWFTPDPWDKPQCQSGEIDLLESCKGPRLQTSFGDMRASQTCTSSKSNLTNLTLEDNKDYDFRMDVEQDQNNVTLVFYYKASSASTWIKRGVRENYQETHGWQQYPSSYHLISDVWNGGDGDEGYQGCGYTPASQEKCKYTVSNIVFTPRSSSAPVFADSTCDSKFTTEPSQKPEGQGMTLPEIWARYKVPIMGFGILLLVLSLLD
jgi:hypothetical protein